MSETPHSRASESPGYSLYTQDFEPNALLPLPVLGFGFRVSNLGFQFQVLWFRGFDLGFLGFGSAV